MTLAKERGVKKEKKKRKRIQQKKLAPPDSDVGVWSQVNYRHQGFADVQLNLAAAAAASRTRRSSSFETACNYICTNVCALFIIYFVFSIA